MSEAALILCSLVAYGPAKCPARIARCCRCDREVWFSDSSPQEATPYCNQCFDVLVDKDSSRITITDEQREALKKDAGYSDEDVDELVARANLYREMGALGRALDMKQVSKDHHPSNIRKPTTTGEQDNG